MSFSLGPIDAAALLGVWIWALWSPATRTARTIAALITITTGYVLLSALPGVVGSVIARAGWLGAAFSLLMLHSDWFLNTSAKDAEFDDALWETQQLLTMAARKRLAGEIDRNAFAREVSDAVPAFERLEPPDKEWAALLEDTVAELRTWLAAQEGVSDEPPLRISELRDRHLRLRNSRESFWR